MNPFNWLAYAWLVGGLLALAAWLLGRVATGTGRPSRAVWVIAALATVALPLVALRRPPAPLSPIFAVGPAWQWPSGPAPLTGMAAIQPPHGTFATVDLEQLLLAGWVCASIAAAFWIFLSYRSLARQRRTWRMETVQGIAVLVSQDVGPAVVGVLRPGIVVPAWFGALSADSQRLALLHEQEHLRAHDSRLLALVLGCMVLMPWQPFLWLQFAALRFAIEIDCDRRVLRQGGARRYADLLLTLAGRVERRGWALPLVALWSTPSRMERRIRLICEVKSPSWRELATAVAGAGLALLLACAANAPAPAVEPVAVAPQAHQQPETERQREQLLWERHLAEFFTPPDEVHRFDERPVYWFLVDTADQVLRHDTGGREIIFRDEQYWKTFRPESWREARARADSAGRHGPLGGFFQVSDGELYERYPDLKNLSLLGYGLMPARFGKDTVMVVFGTVGPASRD